MIFVMKTSVISIRQPDASKIALLEINSYSVIAFPTDTVYGIGCLVTMPKAIEKLFAIKGRDSNKAIPILLGDISQLNQVVQSLSPQAAKLAEHFWPGALTLIVNKQPNLPAVISPYPTIGVRIPNHSWLRQLIIQSGPLAATSANLSGFPEAKNINEVLAHLEGKISLVIDGGQCSGGIPSTVVDCSGLEVKILREGAIKTNEIISVIR
jgi:L-threonylcarbamoyladenylate synthase